MLPDAPDVERVALGAEGIVEGLRKGAIYVDMSTIDPGTTRKVGAAVRAKGAAMIDSPVGKTANTRWPARSR
jgi:3-hydroxyisobutyrate dehydrogenase-like beta-hydroxyacid dehydrogenase